jgi:hypothetical protein
MDALFVIHRGEPQTTAIEHVRVDEDEAAMVITREGVRRLLAIDRANRSVTLRDVTSEGT